MTLYEIKAEAKKMGVGIVVQSGGVEVVDPADGYRVLSRWPGVCARHQEKALALAREAMEEDAEGGR